MYQFIRRIFFIFPPEAVHGFSIHSLAFIGRFAWMRWLIRRICEPMNTCFPVELAGLHFKNPIGLAAGFDKNALYLDALDMLGFGFVEIGTVTPLPQSGNDKPRLFRLPADKALVNRMGFNNQGVSAVAARLKDRRQKNQNSRLIIGGNIGKNKNTENEEAWKDYEICFLALFEWVDYFVVNVSSPNTPGLRALQGKESLRKILQHLQTLNQSQSAKTGIRPRPLFLKIAPDLTDGQLDDVIELLQEIKLDGIVACNTSIDRKNLKTAEAIVKKIGAGGLSGAPVRERATALVKYIHDKTGGQLPIIASGGIFTAADAREKLNAGACLLQVWTGFIYEGPKIVRKILDGNEFKA